MDEELDGEQPSAHARLNLNWGKLLPSVEAEAGVRGRETKPFVRLLIFGVTLGALILTALLYSLLPLWLLLPLLVIELGGGAYLIFKSW